MKLMGALNYAQTGSPYTSAATKSKRLYGHTRGTLESAWVNNPAYQAQQRAAGNVAPIVGPRWEDGGYEGGGMDDGIL